jgi:hypothetical protein
MRRPVRIDRADVLRVEVAAGPQGIGGALVLVVAAGEPRGAQAVAEMCNRHGLSLISAEKAGKSDFIQLMNAEYITGRIRLSPQCAVLKEEYASLIWDDKATQMQEHPACENHAADAALYGWRHCYQYLSRVPAPRPTPGSPEWAKAQARVLFEHAQREVLRGRVQGFDEWGVDPMTNWDDWGSGS